MSGNGVYESNETISYDNIGNPTTYLGASLTWFGRQLKSYTINSQTVNYTYDADGLRSSKSALGVNCTYQYVGGQLRYETRGAHRFYYYYDATGALSAIRYYDANGNASIYFVLTNAQGDVKSIYSKAGALVASYEYDAFGNCTITQDTTGIGALNPIRYRGYYYDSETGFYYLQSRYYNPKVGRFISADSQIAGVGEDVLGYNTFAYCQNNPVNMFDPTGHWPNWVGKLIAVTLVASAVVAAVAITVSTYGAGSVAGVAVITSALTIAAKTTEVIALQVKKNSQNSNKNETNCSETLNNPPNSSNVATNIIEAVFDNGIRILTPGATKVGTTGVAFVYDDFAHNKVLNTSFTRFVSSSAKPKGIAIAYGFAAFAWIQTTISIFSDDCEQRAEERGYTLK